MVTRRVTEHPILGAMPQSRTVLIEVDGRLIEAVEGEPIAAALMAAGIASFRSTPIRHEPRGVFCAIGRCTDCVMTVNGAPNVRTCITPAQEGMKVSTQQGLGEWSDPACRSTTWL